MPQYFVKADEQYPDLASRWILRKDQYTIGRLYVWEDTAREIACRVSTHDDLLQACKTGQYEQDLDGPALLRKVSDILQWAEYPELCDAIRNKADLEEEAIARAEDQSSYVRG